MNIAQNFLGKKEGKMNKKPKPINNHIVISDPEAAEWFRSKLSEPLTEERIQHNKDELKEYEELFFPNKAEPI